MSNQTNTTDFIDYDLNESFSHFDWEELAPVLVVYSLTFFLGLVGEWDGTLSRGKTVPRSCFFILC